MSDPDEVHRGVREQRRRVELRSVAAGSDPAATHHNMQRVSDVELLRLVKDRDVIAFISTGSDREQRLAQQLTTMAVKLKNRKLVELRNTDIVDPAETRLAFVQFPRIITFRDGASDEDVVGFEAVTSWITNL